MQIRTYAKEIQHWIKALLTEKQPEITTHRCCIYISSKEISFLHINHVQDTIEILLLEDFQYDDLSTVPLVLSGMVKKYGLQSIPTSWLLLPEDYQLFLIESLPVAADEFHDALNWRVKSLLNYPIEEAVLDYFKLPAKKKSSENFMVVAVAARMNQLIKTIDMFKKTDLCLTTIDIPELAMRNLTAPIENDEKSTAFIYFFEKIAILNITCQQTLYFTRRLNLPNESEPIAKNYEQVCLDILRYFDYFQSQWRYPSPGRIFVASEKKDTAGIAKILSENLSFSVEPFPLNSILPNSKIDLLEKNLLTLGCALRKEETHATPRN